MSSFISRDSWLLRREGAALFGWGTSFTGPKATRVDATSTNDRHHFVGWPSGWVVKKGTGCGGTYGNLYLEVKTTLEWFEFAYNATSGIAFWDSGTPNYGTSWGGIMSVSGPCVYDPASFAGGDGHVYEQFSWYSNDMNAGTYIDGTADLTGTTMNGPTTGYDDGGLEAYLYNDADYEIFYGNWTTKMTPDDLFTWAAGQSLVTSTTNTSSYYVHKPTDAHWDRSASLAFSVIGDFTLPYNYDGFNYLGDSLSTRGATFLMDEDWTATGRLERITCKFRWRYDPQTSEGCKFWAGKLVSAKVFYKKAAVTKTDGPDGVFYTLGAWVSGGDSAQSLTLHSNYTDGYVADEVTMPTEEGYVYIIDDIEVLSVT